MFLSHIDVSSLSVSLSLINKHILKLWIFFKKYKEGNTGSLLPSALVSLSIKG